ncbi:MAG TPA: hypothetical protein HPQ04_15960 [Rhodospirillaceae bacterium]|nr:hypothetical protein [Rhodospirillaceae bacterium]
MKKTLKLLTAVSATVLVLGLAGTAQAANYLDWGFSYIAADGTSVNGTITTTDTPVPGLTFNDATTQALSAHGQYTINGISFSIKGYDIVSVTGTRTKNDSVTQISGMVGTAGSLQSTIGTSPTYIYDNVLYTGQNVGPGNATAPVVDILGLEYAAGTQQFNLYYTDSYKNNQPTYMENLDPVQGTVLLGSPAQAMPPSPVPVPGALPLFASGLLGMGLLGRRRARTTAKA